MRFVSELDTRSRITQIRLVFRGGSLADPEEMPGLAHFLVRMLLRGTRGRPYRRLTADLERLGASLSVGADATQTSIFGAVLHRNLDAFLDLLAEIILEPAFDADELERLRAIVQGEVRSRLQDPQVAARQAMLSLAYRGTPATRPSIGTLEGVARISGTAIWSQYLATFTRERLVAGVASPEAPEALERRLAGRFGALPAAGPAFVELPAPRMRGRQAVIAERAGMSTVPLYLSIPGIADPDPELPELELANFVFGADFTSRLMQVLRAENGWTYGAGSGFQLAFSAQARPTLFSIYTFPSVEFAALAIPKALELLDAFCADGITPDEFEEARESLGNRCAFTVDTAEKRLSLKVREALTGRPARTPEEYRRWLAGLELARVNQAISRRLSTGSLVVSAAGDPAILQPLLGALPGVESVETLDVQP